MTTDKQRKANMANSKASTGPTTPAGKAKVRDNALKHGLWAARAVLPDEDPEAFEALRQSMIEQFKPVFPLEAELVEEVATVLWRLRRIPQIEAGILELQHNVEQVDAAKEAVRAEAPQRVVLDALQGAESPALVAAQTRLRAAKARTKDGLTMSAAGFLRDAVSDNAVEKVGRHEARLQNRLTRLLSALADLQAGRVEGIIVENDPS